MIFFNGPKKSIVASFGVPLGNDCSETVLGLHQEHLGQAPLLAFSRVEVLIRWLECQNEVLDIAGIENVVVFSFFTVGLASWQCLSPVDETFVLLKRVPDSDMESIHVAGFGRVSVSQVDSEWVVFEEVQRVFVLVITGHMFVLQRCSIGTLSNRRHQLYFQQQSSRTLVTLDPLGHFIKSLPSSRSHFECLVFLKHRKQIASFQMISLHTVLPFFIITLNSYIFTLSSVILRFHSQPFRIWTREIVFIFCQEPALFLLIFILWFTQTKTLW